jgi:hypothetical protein
MAQVVELLPSKCATLSSNPNISRKKKLLFTCGFLLSYAPQMTSEDSTFFIYVIWPTFVDVSSSGLFFLKLNLKSISGILTQKT